MVLVTCIVVMCGSPTHGWGSVVAEQWTYIRKVHTLHHGVPIQSTLADLVTGTFNIHKNMRENGWI